MPRITIRSPDDIRREVNALKQQQRQSSQQRYKRRTLSVDVSIDFGQCPRDKVIQANDLAALITIKGGRLESLSLEHVKVIGDWNVVLDALKTSDAAQHLKTFSSYSCLLRDDQQEMVELGVALSTLPKLGGISLGLSHQKQHPAWKILTPVVQNCKSLTKVFVNGFHGPRQHDTDANQEVVEFFEACAASTSLKRLLCLPMLGRAFGSPAVMNAVGNLIRTNSSLQTLELYILEGTRVVDLASDLKSNRTLTRLALIGRHSARDNAVEQAAFYQAFQDTADGSRQGNYTLQELQVEPWSRNNNTDNAPIQFELSLNRMGRDRLLNNNNGGRGTTTDDWMEAIANKDEISIIYYFLRKNPTLCDPKMWVAEEEEEEDEQSYDSSSYHEAQRRQGRALRVPCPPPHVLFSKHLNPGCPDSPQYEPSSPVPPYRSNGQYSPQYEPYSPTRDGRPPLPPGMPAQMEYMGRPPLSPGMEYAAYPSMPAMETNNYRGRPPPPPRDYFGEQPAMDMDGPPSRYWDSHYSPNRRDNDYPHAVSPPSPQGPFQDKVWTRKRTREEMEEEDDDDNVSMASSLVEAILEKEEKKEEKEQEKKKNSRGRKILRVVTKTAYTAAVFAAGFWARGVAES